MAASEPGPSFAGKFVRCVAAVATAIIVCANACEDDQPREPGAIDQKPTTTASLPEDLVTQTTTSASPTAGSPKSYKLKTTEITHHGKPIDDAGLAALGWRIDPVKGQARYKTAALGSVNVNWEVPGPEFNVVLDYDIWGDVTSNPNSRLAMGAEMGTDLADVNPVTTSAVSENGVKAEAPAATLKVFLADFTQVQSWTFWVNPGWPTDGLRVSYHYQPLN